MNIRNLRWLIAAATFAVIATSQAEVLYEGTFTGAQLPGAPGIDMAADRTRYSEWTDTGYKVEGDSLHFFESASRCIPEPEPPLCEESEKLLELQLAPFMTSTGAVTVSLSASLTWVGWVGDASDPHIMLSDGTHLAGVVVLDVDSTDGGTDLAYCTQSGDMCLNMGYPDPGVPHARDTIVASPPTDFKTYDVNLLWTLDSTTRVDASLSGFDDEPGEVFSGSGIFPPQVEPLDPTAPLSFVFLSDNQNHEKYQLNSLSITVREFEVLSCNCFTPTLFDPPADKDIAVNKGNRVLPLKFTLCDQDGLPVTDVPAPVAEVDFRGTPETDPDFFDSDVFLSAGHGDDGNQFVSVDDHWQLNLQTKMFTTPGVYEIYAVSSSPADYIISPMCSLLFEISE